MDPYSLKVNKIQSTIDEIREDIETMKIKNEKTINNLTNSLSKISKFKIQDLDNEPDEKQKLYRKYDYGLENYSNQNIYGFSSANTNFNSKNSMQLPLNYEHNQNFNEENPNFILYTSPNFERKINSYQSPDREIKINKYKQEYYIKTNHSLELEKQISELQVTINELQKKNTFLQMQLAEANQNKRHYNPHFKNISSANNKEQIKTDPHYAQDENEEEEKNKMNDFVINELKNIFKIEKTEDIIPKIRENIKVKSSKINDELVEKLSNLYLALIGNKKGNSVDIKTLWRWIKSIIKQFSNRQSKSEDDQIKIKDKIKIKDNEEEIYRDYCKNIINEYGLKNLHELQIFINSLLEKNKKNLKRVEKLKKLLLTERAPVKYNQTHES